MLRHRNLGMKFFLGSALFLSGCASTYNNPNLPNLTPSSEYFSLARESTAQKKVYDGFNQVMEFSATLLTTKVSQAQLDHKARMYQWSTDQYSTNKSEMDTGLSKQTKVFLSFYVPERKHDDLHKPATLWKIFLDSGGRRYEGRAEKLKTIFANVQAQYPDHTRFHTPYMITFPVPVSQIEHADSRLTITGPVTSASADFKAVP